MNYTVIFDGEKTNSDIKTTPIRFKGKSIFSVTRNLIFEITSVKSNRGC